MRDPDRNHTFIRFAAGFTLVEIVSALVITGSIIAAAVVVYQRMHALAATIGLKTEAVQTPMELIGLIEDDLSRVDGGPGNQILIENKRERGLPSARLTIRRTITNDRAQEQTIEEIIWQAAYDLASGRLTLYRSRTSVFPEDRLLDKGRSDVEKLYPFVPICPGLSAFTIKAPQGPNLLDRWSSPVLPNAVVIGICFAEPTKTAQGVLDVPDTQMIVKTVAIDPLRSIRLELPQPEPNIPAGPETIVDQNQPRPGPQIRPPASRVPNVPTGR